VAQVASWFDEREWERKRAEETLERGLKEWESSGTLLSEKQLSHIQDIRENLPPQLNNKEAKELLAKSESSWKRQRLLKRAGVVSLMVTTIGLAGYTSWYRYSYEWEHITYCNQFVKRYGLPQCVGELTKEQVQKRPVSYRLLRKGSQNPVYKVQAVQGVDEQVAKQSSTGDLVNDITTLTRRHEVGTYFKPQANRYSDSLVQESQWEFVVDTNGQIVYEKAFDGQDKPVWGLVYSPRLEGKPARAHYVGNDGYPHPQKSSKAEFVEFSYSKQGDEEEVRYFDRQHRPQTGLHEVFVIQRQFNEKGLVTQEAYFNSEGKPIFEKERGYHKFQRKYDELGNMTEETYFDVAGQPTFYVTDRVFFRFKEYEATLYGYYKRKQRYDDRSGNLIEVAYFDATDQPIVLYSGYHKFTKKYDVHGNVIEEAYFDGTDQPVSDRESGVHKLTQKYDAHGNKIEDAYFDTANQPMLRKDGQCHKVTRQYDDGGNLTGMAYFDVDGRPKLRDTWHYSFHKFTQEYDKRGNVTEVAYFDMDNRPTLFQGEGYHKFIRKYDNRGNMTEESYFDVANQPALHKDMGCHKVIQKSDERGNVTEQTCLNTAKQRTPKKSSGAYKETVKYDDYGNMIELASFDVANQPMLHKSSGVHKYTVKNDDRGNIIESACFGVTDQPITDRDGIHKTTRKYDERSNFIEFAYFGVSNQPIFGNSSDLRYHKFTQKYDDHGYVVEQAYFDTTNSPMLHEDKGYHKVTNKYNNRGDLSERDYFNVNGSLTTIQKFGDRKIGDIPQPDEETFFDATGF